MYIAAVEGFTGRSTVALGVLEQLSRRVAVISPVVREQRRRSRPRPAGLPRRVPLSYYECAGVTCSEVHREPDAARVAANLGPR